jgi:hypothetical protein
MPGIIQETCTKIGELEERAHLDLRQRYARRNKIRYIDDLLNDLEMLHLAEEPEIPVELTGRVQHLVTAEGHEIAARPASDVRITDWMEALYDVQDTLMIPMDDDVD